MRRLHLSNRRKSEELRFTDRIRTYAKRMQPSVNKQLVHFLFLRRNPFVQVWSMIKKTRRKGERACTRFGSDILSDNSSCARKQEGAAFLYPMHHFQVHRIIISYDKTDLSSVLAHFGKGETSGKPIRIRVPFNPQFALGNTSRDNRDPR